MLAASNALPRVVLSILLASSPSFAAMTNAPMAVQQQQLPGKTPLKTGAVQGMVRQHGPAEEIAEAAAFLAADGDYITGQELNINGGCHM